MIEKAVFQLIQDNLEKKCFLVAKKPAFSAHAKPTDKEKPFFSTAKFQFRTAPKLTRSHKFYPRKLTVSLQCNIPFSKLRSLALALWLPFRTDSKPLRRRFAGKTGFGTSRRKALQNLFRQSFESSPESRGSQTSGVLLVLFVQAKSTKNVPFAGSSEVSQTSNQHTAAAASRCNN